ncbi:MAG TPA: TIGR02281 family clan AA aspartic protease [Caulobacteraceae bacterium]|jgi:aspartyl protease family protein|nr:TIGR02281 family clan AA aspartic protease [Caulobacteraceae bacterium]
MLKHAAILAAAVLSAILSAQGLMLFAAPRASASAQVQPMTPAAPPPLLAQAEAAPQPAQISKASDGHYWAQANVNGHWVKFLVDTGASAVALTAVDARRLGLDPDSLDYVRPVTTAGGQTMAAQIKLDHVTVAGARIDNVDALVVREGLSTSLLGMTYLGRLSRFEATRTALILRP